VSKLRISSSLSLPREVVTSTTVVYGGKGMGKTNLGSVLVEELSRAGLRWSALDPMGVWWGLRHSADGKGEGIQCLILGGAHGDLPIEPTAGSVVADLVADEDVDVIIDISRKASGQLWSVGEKIRFSTEYVQRLFLRQGELLDGRRREPILQILDEAARYVPQTIPAGRSDLALSVGAWEQLVEEGRNVGIGVLLLTHVQRMSETVERATADDPKTLRARIRQLEHDLKGAEFAARIAAESQEPVLRQEQPPKTPPSRTPYVPRVTHISKPRPPADASSRNGTLSGSQQRILNSLAWYEWIGIPQPTKIQAGMVAGYRVGKRVGGTYGNLLGQLRSTGHLDYSADGRVALTEKGRAHAQLPDIEPTTEALQAEVFARLDEPERRVLRAIVEAYPEPISKPVVGERAGYTVGDRVGGTFGNILGRLRTLGLIEYPSPGQVVAEPILFVEGARA
jgi:hypothetical protein